MSRGFRIRNVKNGNRLRLLQSNNRFNRHNRVDYLVVILDTYAESLWFSDQFGLSETNSSTSYEASDFL